MSEAIAYFDGEIVKASSAAVPVWDAGFVLGTTVAEQLRTFGGKLFKLDAHLERLAHSLEIIGVDAGLSVAEFTSLAERVATHNHKLLPAGGDLGLSIFVTPGPYAALAPPEVARRPLVAMHTYALPFRFWADKYRSGVELMTSNVRQVPAECWPAELKCRSRMHYHLATHDVQQRHPGAVPLLVDHNQHVCETPTANVVAFVEGEGLITPPRERILPGVSMAMVAELAAGMDVAMIERDMTPAELAEAEEIMLTSTPFALLPVVSVDGRTIGTGRPGVVFEGLLRRWSAAVGVDVVGQAQGVVAHK
jgi:branched-subunit amino acid aminotransferase/4-amino-4-deoxychorismate lyase